MMKAEKAGPPRGDWPGAAESGEILTFLKKPIFLDRKLSFAITSSGGAGINILKHQSFHP